MITLLTRAGFVGRVAVLAAGGLLTSVTSSPKETLCAQMTTPDYGAWEALLKAHVKPSEMRGIGVNVVDYDGEISNSAVFWSCVWSVVAARRGALQQFYDVLEGCQGSAP